MDGFTIEHIFDCRRYCWYSCYDDVYWLWHPLAAHAG